MANLDITNIDNASIALGGEEFRDGTLTFAAADTFVEGTILARRAVATAITASAVSGGGDGTVTAATVVAGGPVPRVGVYTLRNTAAVTNGGVWRLEDPDGNIVASDLRMTVGALAATVFKAGGMTFTITDGATDFSLGATATLTTTADGKLVPYNPAVGGGVAVPVAVLTYEVTKAGSGDLPVRVLVAGRVNKNRLIIDVDGTGANITNAVCDTLISHGIVPIDVTQLSKLDNQ